MGTEQCVDLDRFIDLLPIGVVVFDQSLQIVRCNNIAMELLGIGIDEMLSGSGRSIITNTELLNALRKNPSKSGNQQHLMIEKDNRTLSCMIKHSDESESGEIILIIEDTTVLYKIEQIKRDFVKTILHKLRTPLSTLKTSLSMMQGDKVPDLSQQSREILSMSYDEVNRLSTLVTDLKDMFQIETGIAQNDIVIENFTVRRVLDAVLTDIRKASPLLSNAIARLAVSGNDETMLCADFEKVKKILYVLVKNAFCYSADNTPVSISITNAGDTSVLIRVRDNGIGIAEENLPFIFDKYYRENNHLTRRIDGNGLGLFIAKSYAEIMGGFLSCESKQNSFSSFCVGLSAASERK